MTPFQSDKHMTQGRKIHPAVWALGFVSLFMDISSEIIHSLLPVFLVSVIEASVQTVGLIEGVAEATAMVTRIFFGSLSDWLGKCKLLAIVGYGLGDLSKPLFALAFLGFYVCKKFGKPDCNQPQITPSIERFH